MSGTLNFKGVSAFYGSSQILHNVNLIAKSGKVTCLLGLNGMGKTTTLRTAMGLVDRQVGEIALNGKALEGTTYRRARAGLTLVPEDRKAFTGLTVQENLDVSKASRNPKKDFIVADVLRIFPRLAERLRQKAGTMSGGEQQMLVVGRALLANPLFMLLDEPTEGLSPEYVEAIKTSIELARERGVGVVLVEQSLALALSVGDEFYIMQNGRVQRNFGREEVVHDQNRLAKYLVVE